jgi:hypothetical protein
VSYSRRLRFADDEMELVQLNPALVPLEKRGLLVWRLWLLDRAREAELVDREPLGLMT